ncbi:MAG: transposase, partial [Syntrophorhabdaceae bacterium]|nr:transposase [Syntrophorhabdaceae bacterium]
MINRFISSLRYKVEQTIGTLKRTYHFIRMRYKGLAKGDYDSKLSWNKGKGYKNVYEGKNLRVRG